MQDMDLMAVLQRFRLVKLLVVNHAMRRKKRRNQITCILPWLIYSLAAARGGGSALAVALLVDVPFWKMCAIVVLVSFIHLSIRP